MSDEDWNGCERCDGEGSYFDLAPCTTFGSDCACNGPRVLVDPCLECGGTGVASAGRRARVVPLLRLAEEA